MKRKIYRTFLWCLTALGLFSGFIPGASAAAPSGTCGILTAMPHTFAGTGVVGKTYNLDILALIDFTNSQITYNLTTDTVNSSPPDTTASVTGGPVAFTMAAGPLNGSYAITFTPTGASSAITLNLLPVNSGNTILVQGENDEFHGVCQML